MEKVAVSGNRAGSLREVLGQCAAAVLAVCALAPAVRAQDAAPQSADILVAEARVEQPLQVQVRTSTLPRLDAQDSGFQAPRVDLSVSPSRAKGFGAVVGMSGFSQNGQGLGLQPQRPSVDLGVRWTGRLQSQNQVDVMAWRRMNGPEDAYSLIQMNQPVYGARVEMNLSARSAKSGFAVDRGFLGFQLESGARITIKRKDGRPMVYYRTTF